MYSFFKRLLDIVLSLTALIVLAPLLLVLALLVKLDSPGPALFKQKRVGRNEKLFDIYKFRSMYTSAPRDVATSELQNAESHITRVGRVLRKTSLDELPQLFNILKGDMSVVGPRPERPELTEQYKKEMPEFEFRLKVKAGLTGYAQVTGVYDTSPYDKLKMDLMYIENYSARMDLQIILMTLKTMLFPGKTNAETEEGVLPCEHQTDKEENDR